MSWRFPLISLGLLTFASAQVRIHDVGVRLLAKPYGIEKRIELQSIDGLYCNGSDTKRLLFTLRNSGVKEVILNKPEFSLDVVLPNGQWASLGILKGCRITFPKTGDSIKASRSYTAELRSDLTRADVESYLRQSARASSPIRLIGKAELIVQDDGRKDFSKKNVRLELSGPTTLSNDFKAVSLSKGKALPEAGVKAR